MSWAGSTLYLSRYDFSIFSCYYYDTCVNMYVPMFLFSTTLIIQNRKQTTIRNDLAGYILYTCNPDKTNIFHVIRVSLFRYNYSCIILVNNWRGIMLLSTRVDIFFSLDLLLVNIYTNVKV